MCFQHEVLSNKVGCGYDKSHLASQSASQPCDGNSLLFEAFVAPKFNYQSLKSAGSPFETIWNGWTPTVQHREIKADLYYSNDAKFVQDIPEFKAMDHYVMRWRGQIAIPQKGIYTFKTVSDDGSMLYIDSKLVVDNDGLHGARAKKGNTEPLSAGKHDITVTFCE